MENQPTPEQQERIKQITDFHSDLLRLRDLLNKHEMEVSTAHNSHKKPPEYPKEAESLRQSLIRRSGPVKAITDRLAGVMVLPLPYSHGQVEAWQLALHPTEHFSQAYFVGAIADQVLTAIGTAEYDPALLNPPRPAEPKSTGQPPLGQTINIHGGNVNIAQSASGNVVQSITASAEAGEIRRLLGDLEDALSQVEAPAEEREAFVSQIHQIRVEISQPKPIIGRLLNSWAAVSAWATLEGAWQGWDRVQSIAAVLAPKLNDFIQAVTRATGA